MPEIALRHDREKPWQVELDGTVLFADVSGFTPMAEALSVLGAEGAEILTGILNRCFAAMIGIVGAHGGQAMKFGGDALQCFFPEVGSPKPEAGEKHVAAPCRVRPDSPMENRGNTAQAEARGYNQHGWHPELDSGSFLIYALPAARLMQECMSR